MVTAASIPQPESDCRREPIVVVEGTGAVDKETDEGEVAELLDATLQDVNKSTRHIYM